MAPPSGAAGREGGVEFENKLDSNVFQFISLSGKDFTNQRYDLDVFSKQRILEADKEHMESSFFNG